MSGSGTDRRDSHALEPILIADATANLAPGPVEVGLETGIPAPDGLLLIDLLTGERSEADAGGHQYPYREGYGDHWFRVGGLDALLKRKPA